MPEYWVWRGMKSRCSNPNSASWKHYGGRGIKVCQRWMSSFEDFLTDVGPRTDPSLSLDRIDNNGNYEPGNVRWATPKEQCSNQRTNRIISVGGEKVTVAEAARRLRMSSEMLRCRVLRGLSGDALLRPPDPKFRRNPPITLNGKTMLVSEWAVEVGICDETIRQRIKKGWPVEKAITTPRANSGRPRKVSHRAQNSGHVPSTSEGPVFNGALGAASLTK